MARFARELSREHELGQEIAREILLLGEPPHHRIARAFEVDREAAGKLSGRADLALVGARQHLEVNVAGKSLAAPQDVNGREHAVHGPLRAPGDARCEKEPVSYARAMG